MSKKASDVLLERVIYHRKRMVAPLDGKDVSNGEMVAFYIAAKSVFEQTEKVMRKIAITEPRLAALLNTIDQATSAPMPDFTHVEKEK